MFKFFFNSTGNAYTIYVVSLILQLSMYVVCYNDDWLLEEEQVSLLGPRGDVSREHEGHPRQGALGQGAGEDNRRQ